MKLRKGFVSNSSSTSFCIYGAIIPYDTYSEIEIAASKLGLTEHADYQDSDNVILGKSLLDCPDNMTMGDFKKGVDKQLQTLLKKKDIKCQSLCDGWFNG